MSDWLTEEPDILIEDIHEAHDLRWQKICQSVKEDDTEFWQKWEERNKQQWWDTLKIMPKELKVEMLKAYHQHPKTYLQKTSDLIYTFYNPPKQIKPRWKP